MLLIYHHSKMPERAEGVASIYECAIGIGVTLFCHSDSVPVWTHMERGNVLRNHAIIIFDITMRTVGSYRCSGTDVKDGSPFTSVSVIMIDGKSEVSYLAVYALAASSTIRVLFINTCGSETILNHGE